jgi:Replication-relaxation
MTYPLGYPLALTKAPGFCLQTATSACNSGDDSCALMCHNVRTPMRAGRALAAHGREHLSERELAMVTSVDRYRYLSAKQLEELHFFAHATPLTGARTCRRVLSRLTKAGILWRLERRIGGIRAGSVSYVYALTPLGYRALHDGGRTRVRRREPSAEFLDHTLAIAQLAVELHLLTRADRDVDLLEVEPEPGCWRRFTAGLEGAQTLKPDLSVSLKVGDYEYHWFVEVDLSTHSAAAVVRKCRVYNRYWATGIEQDRSGLFPKVLLVAPIARRASLLERTIGGAPHLNVDLFAVTTTAGAMACLTGAAS